MERRGRRICGKPENRGRYNPRKMASTYIWRPCIPRWEKEFTMKIGNIKWEDFVEASKYTYMDKKIMDWNDTACEEAFTAAKTRFWYHYNGHESKVLLPDPDMYIDKNIDWTSAPQENKEDEDSILSLSDVEEEDDLPIMLPPLTMEPIIPTGWDVDDVPQTTTDLQTGFIVGDDDSENGNILRDSINILRE